MNIWIASLLSAACGYLLGSISFAVIVSRIYAKDDVRNHGSGNAGMTNMLRTYGRWPAIFTLLGDFAKGACAVLLARWIFSAFAVTLFDGGYLGALFAVLGHLFPLYFGFRGGKGVMTSIGVILVLDPLIFLCLLVVGVPVVLLTGMVSLGSLTGAALFPLLTLGKMCLAGQIDWLGLGFSLLLGALVIVMHRENIRRLRNGTENRFGKRK